MTIPGKVYVAPIGPEGWSEKDWKELGWTTEDGVIASINPAEPPLITMGRIHEFKVPDLTEMSQPFQSMTLTFKAMADSLRSAGFLYLGYMATERPERISRLRSAYRHKRGRRRFH
jgi:hypothetical protein